MVIVLYRFVILEEINGFNCEICQNLSLWKVNYWDSLDWYGVIFQREVKISYYIFIDKVIKWVDYKEYVFEYNEQYEYDLVVYVSFCKSYFVGFYCVCVQLCFFYFVLFRDIKI